ncbi:MAG: sporulation transcription factor Spo0A [bacterium]|nr:sporulation transcription factor Spo0A [bacterium]
MNTSIRAIVVDDNTVAVNNLRKYFNQNDRIKIVASFSNGEEALEYLINNNGEIDLVILELLIPRLDGATLLEEIKSRKLTPKIIVTSGYKDNNIINDCAFYNVCYYLIKPFSILSLEKRINEVFESKNLSFSKNNSLDLEISQLLHNLGIPSHIRGYKYIRDGILIIYNNESVSLVTKEIYPQIALKYETTPSRVERAIRHAIEVSWIRGDINLMEDLFGFSVSCEKSKPTNSEFLTTIADRIKLDSKAF